MKKVLLICGLFLLVFTSCRKEESEPTNTIAQQILGRWRLIKVEDTYYSPINVLKDKEEHMGTVADSVVFKKDNMMYSYSPVSGDDVTPYHVVNDSTIEIEYETWKITRLTDTEFHLVSEDVDLSLDEKYSLKIFLAR